MIFLKLFLTFFKIGLFSFGGGYAMIPLIQSEVVLNGWIDFFTLIDFIAVSQSFPGPFAVNISTYIGSELAGFWGAASAVLGVVLPGFAITLIAANFFDKFKDNALVKGAMSGLKPVVIGLIASSAISLFGAIFFPNGYSLTIFTQASFYSSLFIFTLSLILSFRRLHPIAIVCISAVLGVASGYLF